MSAKQVEQIKKVHEEIQRVAVTWPDGDRELTDQYGAFLEKLLARAVGEREIVFAYAVAEPRTARQYSSFAAVLFTERLIFVGSVAVPEMGEDRQMAKPRVGSVRVLPRRAIVSVELQGLQGYTPDAEDGLDAPGFTLHVEGHDPIAIDLVKQRGSSEKASKLLDALIEEL